MPAGARSDLPLPARVYGVRLFYRPGGRLAVAAACAIVAVADYVKEAIGDLANINHRPLQFDFGQFQRAAQDLSAGRSPYDFFVSLHCQSWCLGGYIYTPLFAEGLRPLAHVPLPQAAATWLVLSHLMLLATVVLLWRLLRGHTTIAAMAAMLAAGLLYQPLFENLSYVQIGILLLLVMSGAAALHLRRRSAANAAAGALVGLATVIKITPILAAPALLPVGWAGKGAAGEWREGAAGLAGLAASVLGLTVAMLLFVPHTADFFTQVLPHIGGGTTAYENKSFPAMVGRVFDLGRELGWQVNGPDSKVVTLATMALFLLPVIWASARPLLPEGDVFAARSAAFAAYVAAMPIVSTITWRHHIVVNLLAMALLLPALWPLAGRAGSRAARWLLVLSYPLSYIQQDVADRVATSGGLDHHTLVYAARYLLVEDLNLFGMICLWIACLLALRGLGATARMRAPMSAHLLTSPTAA